VADEGWIKRVMDRVVDGQPVDWEPIEKAPLSPDERRQIELLRLLEALGSVHSGSLADDRSVGIEPDDDPTNAVQTDRGPLGTWGRYVLEQQVGSGGFGVVYRAWDPELEMTVAIKILHRLGPRDEGRKLAQLRHPNIVRVLNLEEHEGRQGLVMEFVRGETLEALVRARGTFNDREAAVIAEDICRALAAVHGSGLIHRDVKARNIMRERAGRLVLMDFGAGERVNPDTHEGRSGGAGTPLYLAPEILDSRPASPASDVYAVGVLLFFLVSGRYPYEGKNLDEICAAHAAGRRRSLVEFRSDVSPPFLATVERALAVKPGDRFPTAAAMLKALGAVTAAKTDWLRLLRRAAMVAGGLIVWLVASGVLASAWFNRRLGRSEFADESIADWLLFGTRTSVLPIFLLLAGPALLGLVVAVRWLVVRSSKVCQRLDAAVWRHASALAHRCSLHDPVVLACWVLVLSAGATAAAWTHFAPLLEAIFTDPATAPARVLAILSPTFVEFQTNYRAVLYGIVLLNVIAWYGITRRARRLDVMVPRVLHAIEVATLVLVVVSTVLPYRFVYGARFPAVRWEQRECYILGERRENTLLFCPNLSPSRRAVLASPAPGLQRLNRMDNIFESFAPPATESPVRSGFR